MIRLRGIALLAIALIVSGCPENSAPGNDREAHLDQPKPPASLAAVDGVVQGLDPSVLIPQAMTEDDVRSLPVELRPCVFRFTEEGQPVVTYGSGGAVLKLNGTLARVPSSGDGRYGSSGVDITLRTIDEEEAEDGFVRTEFVLRVPGAADELGYHGFAECDTAR